MYIKINNTYIAEIASKFFDRNYDEKDIENGTVTEEMIRLAILCEFEVIDRCDYKDTIKRLCK